MNNLPKPCSRSTNEWHGSVRLPGGQPRSDLGQLGCTAQKQGKAEQSCSSAVLPVISVGMDLRLFQRPNVLRCVRNTAGAGGCGLAVFVRGRDSCRGWNATLISSPLGLGHWSQAMKQEKDILLESRVCMELMNAEFQKFPRLRSELQW